MSSVISVRPKAQHKLIIGVDYGTTFTGVSYVLSSKTGLEDIHIIRSWPGPGKEAEAVWKTPSRLAFKEENQSLISTNQWGYQVTAKMKSYSWTKLLLDRNASFTEYDDPILQKSQGEGLLKLPDGRSATEVCADYLREIYKYTIADLERRLSPEIVSVTPFEFWFTVPAIWSDQAKNSTKRAAEIAGFGSRLLFDSLNFIPEPEAAAVATLSTLNQRDTLIPVKRGEGLIVCDCGGGTVDITTYMVAATKPLEFEELVVGIGGKCGSTYIDRNFHQWMSKRFGPAFDSVAMDKKAPGSRFMREFESYKRDFGHSDDPDIVFEVPLLMRNVQDSEYYDVDESTVKFYRKEMLFFFEPAIQKIIDLLDQQMEAVARGSPTSKITKVILVGGFGDSPHLNKRLRSWCKARGNIRLLCPEHPQAAIVKGAALRGLIGLKAVRKQCRVHYGVCLHLAFRPGIDPEDLGWVLPWNGEKRCKGRMIWKISKGQMIDENYKISHNVFNTVETGSDMTHELELYSCHLDQAPEYKRDRGVKLVGIIQVKFSDIYLEQFESKIIKGVKTWRVEYELKIHLAPKDGVMRFQCVAGDQEVGSTTIRYDADV